jgi:hypothetical protein
MPFPFEVPYAQVEANLDAFVNEVFGALQSEFLNLPKGQGFIDYSTFSKGYERLKAVHERFPGSITRTDNHHYLPNTDQLYRIAYDLGFHATRMGVHHLTTQRC